MKTLLLISIIAAIGISLVALTFVYQHIQNCETEGGSITRSLGCDKSQYALMTELFQKKYEVIRANHIDRADGAITESMATNRYGDSITLIIIENLRGPYYAEIICKHKDSKNIETITENILAYLQNEDCFMPTLEETGNVESIQMIKTNQYLLEISHLNGNYIQNKEFLFYVHEKGFDIRCFSVYAEIFDSSGNKIWEQSTVEECPPGLGESYFDHKISFSGIKISKAGEYRLVVQSREYEITRSFSVLDENLVR